MKCSYERMENCLHGTGISDGYMTYFNNTITIKGVK